MERVTLALGHSRPSLALHGTGTLALLGTEHVGHILQACAELFAERLGCLCVPPALPPEFQDGGGWSTGSPADQMSIFPKAVRSPIEYLQACTFSSL